ncbi:MAG: hypothetical protein COU33_00850 [Candidatus Magasanikbacteria bacterium CG10_big_fil_rev_8_21_14_0_10_43_6]|uniref:ABC transporter ATP-binding protein n=1 Tax=Candidatus Magasanikbacteria bacterium CG10_big_fil_rev_8_21_14_0_10_43_6 TaxID=1974650 RepID=A0A2M6W258_9BACT|nr:MAG: hypothetical protein COU33_00850 [Candidatus Magasanikbacteria bacterium CG10_big_fil_rev_8_21_14_0_10_43_6]
MARIIDTIKRGIKKIGVIVILYTSFKEYRFEIILLVCMGFVSGILEGIGVNALVPLFSFATKDSGAEQDMVTQYIERLFGFIGIDVRISSLLLFILCLFLLRTVVLLALYYVKIKINADYEEKTRKSLLHKTFRATWSHLLGQKMGKLDSLLVTHVQYASNALLQLSSTLVAAAVLLVYVLMSLNISFTVTITTFVVGLISLFILKPLFSKTMHIGHKAAAAVEQVAHFVNQNMLGMKTIKYMGVEKPLMEAGEVYFKHLKEYKIKVYVWKNFSPQFLQMVGLIFICFLFGLSYKYQYLSFGALVALIYLIQRIFSYIQQLQVSIHSMSESLPYLESVSTYGSSLKDQAENITGEHAFVFGKTLAFKDVTFSYPHGGRVLDGISFEIKKGETVAIIGPSGSGKTTIVDLILRLFLPGTGDILIDGVSSDTMSLSDWRSNIGYMSQDMFLINDTILNNIIFFDEKITRADAEKAAQKACIYEFISTCADGMETLVGERGISLSVGQRQRIVIARILARNPSILILDEATSALDAESEMRVQEVIHALKGEVTVILVAHRLSTVKKADTILVLAEGVIVEQGVPSELLKDETSYFYRMLQGNIVI